MVSAARGEAVVVAEVGGTVSVPAVRALSCGVTSFRGSDVIRGFSYVPQPLIPSREQREVNRCIIRHDPSLNARSIAQSPVGKGTRLT